MQLRPYQLDAVQNALRWLKTAPVGTRRLYTAPTGTGKGVIQRDIHDFTGALVLTPSLEIARNWGCPEWVMTPVRFRNAILAGKLTPPPIIIVDEGHHDVSSNVSYGDIILECALYSRFLGYTATPYRGTPRGTVALRALWGEAEQIISLKDAVEGGYLLLPQIGLQPLLDDDMITVANGAFQVGAASSATGARLPAIAELAKQFAGRPTTICLPSTEACDLLSRMTGWPAVLQGTTEAERVAAVEACRAGTPLIQIGILSEGVDWPWLEVLIDARPTLSPVRWMQTFGRLTRPAAVEKVYVCTNRNLERHAYLLEGMLPRTILAHAQGMFGEPSRRCEARAFGLEGVGKFKSLPVPLAGGAKGSLYNLYALEREGNVVRRREYAVLLYPERAEPVVASRINEVGVTGEMTWGRWRRCELPGDLSGFATSQQRGEMSSKQAAWWKRSASAFGLDDTREPAAREFAALPILADLAKEPR